MTQQGSREKVIRLAVNSKVLIPPLSARATKQSGQEIWFEDNTYDPRRLLRVLDKTLSDTPLQDLMLEG